jgi:opacity protein-like surface antigen
MKKILLVALVLVMAFSTAVFAGVEQGKQEIGGSISKYDTDAAEVTLIFANYGMFVTDELQVAGNILIMDTDADASATGLEAQAKYHFIEVNDITVPYAGGYLGHFNMEVGGDSESAISYGFMFGVKHFISEDTSINAEYNHKVVMMDAGDEDLTVMSVGFAVYF